MEKYTVKTVLNINCFSGNFNIVNTYIIVR